MGAFEHMSRIYPDLVKKAIEHNYPESSICILQGKLQRLKEEFPQIYSNLMSCGHHRDRRTPLEYGQDLVSSWLFEDSLMQELENRGLCISKAGADKNREILANAKVSASSDCTVSYNEKDRLLEIMNDYTGYWARYRKMELRDSKFSKLQESKSLFLGISTVDNKYILLDMSKEFEYKYIQSYFLYGGKPAYSIKLPKDIMKELDFTILAKEIMDLI